MAQSRLLIASIAALLAVPLGAATWFAPGTYEPDTKCDDATGCTNPATGQQISGGWMYNTPPDGKTTGLRIYLNGYASAPQTSGVNPNSEVLGSRHQANSLTFYAYFGVWKDCNEDGYIGAALGALHVYKTDLGINASVCQDGSVFNKGGWVYEFQWIGAGNMIAGENGGDYPSPDDIRYINDSAARVWSDWDLPGHLSPGGSSCPTRPSFGTTASTGAAIAHVDCITTRNIARTINTASTTSGLGFGFEGHTSDPYRSKSPLNQDLPFNLFGNPYAGENNDEWQTGILEYNSKRDRTPDYDDDLDYQPDEDNRMFDAWDCNSQDTYADPTENTPADPAGAFVDPDEDGVLFTTGHLSPSVNKDPLHSSAYDGLNATERGANGALHWLFSDVTGVTSNGLLGANTRTCSEDQRTNAWFSYGNVVENGQPGNDDVGAGRVAAETLFTFTLGGQPTRGCQSNVDHPLAEGQLLDRTPGENVTNCQAERSAFAPLGTDSGELLNETLGEGYQFGVNYRGALVLRPGWTGTPPWVTTSPINRRDLEPVSGRYVTIYGTFGAATTSTGAVTARGNVPALYADEWCNGVFTADTKADGFNCKASDWYAQSEPQANGISIAIRPGQPYYARDIDCYDGEVARGSDVYASLAQLGRTGPCVDSASS